MTDGIKTKKWGYRHVVLVVLWLLYIINYFDRICVLTFLPVIRQDLGLTHQEVGFAASIFFLAYAFAQFSAGLLADKFGPKKIMGIAIVVFTAVTFLTGMVKTYGQFIVLRLGLGLGEGHHYAPAVRCMSNWFPKQEVGRVMGFFATSWAIAPAVIPILVTSIAAAFDNDWRFCFYLLALPGVVGMIILWVFISDKPEQMLAKGRLSQEEYDYITQGIEDGQSQHDSSVTYNIKDVLPDFSLWVFCVMLFCIQAVYWGTTAWMSSWLYEQHGLSLKAMGFMASVPYIVAIFSMLLGGTLMDKVFKRFKPVGLIAFGGCIPVLIFMTSIGKGDIAVLLTTLFLLGFFVNIIWCCYGYVPLRYPKAVVGSVVGLGNMIGYFGAFCSPLVSGYLVKDMGNGSFDFTNIFYMLAGLCAVGFVMALLLSEKPYTPSKRMAKNTAEAVS